jgi:hypothetical protein
MTAATVHAKRALKDNGARSIGHILTSARFGGSGRLLQWVAKGQLGIVRRTELTTAGHWKRHPSITSPFRHAYMQCTP